MTEQKVYRLLHFIDCDNGWVAFDIISAKNHEHLFYEYIKFFDSRYDFEEFLEMKSSRPIVDEDKVLHFENGDKFDLKQPKEIE